MGSSVIMAANSAGLQILPKSFGPVKQQSEESHQAAKLDTSATAKAVISCFKKLGVSFDDQIEMIWDPKEQKELVGVPDEYLSGHAFHFYYLSSPGKTVSLEFQHNVCGRSIYAEGTIDAVLFLAEKRIDRMLRWILLNLNGTAVVAKGERESRVALPSMQENLSNKGVKNELEWPFFCNVPLGL
uniref:Dihydrodipicolinate reductase family protein n=1 Tax=Populus alba TaxID=43335 RepID=A0A4U5QZ21_POPAL|nr:dihydrodipicolinate reductase family protein [Populus alba]